jgi:hypothetical protein
LRDRRPVSRPPGWQPYQTETASGLARRASCRAQQANMRAGQELLGLVGGYENQTGRLGTGALPGLVARPVLPEVPEGPTQVRTARRAITIWTPGIGETPLEVVIP